MYKEVSPPDTAGEAVVCDATFNLVESRPLMAEDGAGSCIGGIHNNHLYIYYRPSAIFWHKERGRLRKNFLSTPS